MGHACRTQRLREEEQRLDADNLLKILKEITKLGAIY